jgi:hypothetical protein
VPSGSRNAGRLAAAALAWLVAPGCERAGDPAPEPPRPPSPAAPAAPPLDPADAARLERLGYLGGYRPASGAGGVSLHDPGRALAGVNLYTSGHAPAAFLVDMRGEPLHRWEIAYRDAFPDAPADALERAGTRYLRRVHLFENGDLLAVFDYFGLVKIDRGSRLLFAKAMPVHHDVFAAGDRIYALAEEVHEVPRLRPGRRVREDEIRILDARGDELGRVSLLRALERSRWSRLLSRLPAHDDLFHTNTIQILDGSLAERSPAFRRGNALVAIRNLDLVAVVDLEREEIVWATQGSWHLPHEPILLPSGRLLLFDNLGLRTRSRALEVEPATGAVVWSFAGEGAGFLSEGMGAVQRLPNGNTIVTDSFGGRALEVDPAGRVVWRFDNPARTGERGELVAVIPELLRLDPAPYAAWLGAAPRADERDQSPLQNGRAEAKRSQRRPRPRGARPASAAARSATRPAARAASQCELRRVEVDAAQAPGGGPPRGPRAQRRAPEQPPRVLGADLELELDLPILRHYELPGARAPSRVAGGLNRSSGSRTRRARARRSRRIPPRRRARGGARPPGGPAPAGTARGRPPRRAGRPRPRH